MTQTTYRHAISSYNLLNAPFPALSVFLFFPSRFSPPSSSFVFTPSLNTNLCGFAGSLGNVFCACEFLNAVVLAAEDSRTGFGVVLAVSEPAIIPTADRFA